MIVTEIGIATGIATETGTGTAIATAIEIATGIVIGTAIDEPHHPRATATFLADLHAVFAQGAGTGTGPGTDHATVESGGGETGAVVALGALPGEAHLDEVLVGAQRGIHLPGVIGIGTTVQGPREGTSSPMIAGAVAHFPSYLAP